MANLERVVLVEEVAGAVSEPDADPLLAVAGVVARVRDHGIEPAVAVHVPERDVLRRCSRRHRVATACPESLSGPGDDVDPVPTVRGDDGFVVAVRAQIAEGDRFGEGTGL